MDRRTSEHIRSRTSVALVEETRGVPYKVISIILGGFFTTCGIRDLFFCGTPFTSDPLEALFLSAFKDCRTDIYQEGISGTLGALLIVLGMVRVFMSTAEKTADLYYSLIPLVFVDACWLFVAIRPGWGKVPHLYLGMVTSALLYESYVLLLARRSFLVRWRAKQVLEEANKQE